MVEAKMSEMVWENEAHCSLYVGIRWPASAGLLSTRTTWIHSLCLLIGHRRIFGPLEKYLTMTTQPEQKSSFGCIGILFGCGIKTKVSDENDIAPSKCRSQAMAPSSPITVEDDGKHNKKSATEQQAPPSPDKTEATEDDSHHSVDYEMPDVDDPATHAGSANSATGNNSGSILRGSSAMEKNIMRVLFSFLLTLLTLGLAGRSAGSGKKAITDGSSERKSSNLCTAENPDACSTEKKED